VPIPVVNVRKKLHVPRIHTATYLTHVVDLFIPRYWAAIVFVIHAMGTALLACNRPHSISLGCLGAPPQPARRSVTRVLFGVVGSLHAGDVSPDKAHRTPLDAVRNFVVACGHRGFVATTAMTVAIRYIATHAADLLGRSVEPLGLSARERRLCPYYTIPPRGWIPIG